MNLKHRKILLGITGSIAAYKTCELVRQLQREGAEVQVIMTESARQFVSPMVLEALSGRSVRDALFDRDAERAMSHIELARWADAMLIAPASAQCLSRLASGAADDLLTTVCLATRAPLLIAPAMNPAMWGSAATQNNVATLRQRGLTVLEPDQGEHACGEVGTGRMPQPEELIEVLRALGSSRVLQGIHALVTAGPTREKIDPARYISNYSSGRLGCAIAEALLDQGAKVTLACGPISAPLPEGAEVISVESAEDMLQAVTTHGRGCDLVVASAAVSDWRVTNPTLQKYKKTTGAFSLELEPTPDILAQISRWNPRPFVVGFAAETEQLIENARSKLRAKGADWIVANHIGDGQGFGDIESRLEIVSAEGVHSLGPASKSVLARQLIERLAAHFTRTASVIEFQHRAAHQNSPAG